MSNPYDKLTSSGMSDEYKSSVRHFLEPSKDKDAQISDLQAQLAEANARAADISTLLDYTAEKAAKLLAQRNEANARADEAIERCAKEVEAQIPNWCFPGQANCLKDVAKCIRALKYAPAQGGQTVFKSDSQESPAGGLARAAVPDADGHCTICGLPWPDERETLEPHECPPGFKR